mmetsp:Transcript_29606/g.42273  ORF Transcript_29606/g.42273 Transcript_29606/m.42273 type:complete len:201 (-) Transcript_29606:539-1141(-)
MGAVLNKDIFWTTLNFLMPFISRRVQKLTIEYFTLACLGWTCQGLKFLCVGVNTGIIIFLQQTANQFVDEENGNFIDNAIYAFILGSTIAITSLACVPLLDIAVGVIVSHILNQLRLQAKVEGQSFAYNIVFTFRKVSISYSSNNKNETELKQLIYRCSMKWSTQSVTGLIVLLEKILYLILCGSTSQSCFGFEHPVAIM